ncbi:hypothetical protein JAAARDRAFT_38647 [Jaapia argillacea MUCL 33604]|uniref:F-box domain-containing protein n=1 Tax=Jaapia argillacea MUCL 33604 TaxID=933084 RepID=A0A067PGL3_9AGAM|nr:hypothetical protein JAAARDRAFT_38647 [Jaapia argillacea MUCL 33604]
MLFSGASLPPELWPEVFLGLSRDDLRSVSLACHSFYSFVQPLLFTRLSLLCFARSLVDEEGVKRTCFQVFLPLESTRARLRHYASPQIARFVKVCTFDTNWGLNSSGDTRDLDRDPYEVRSNSSRTPPDHRRINDSHSIIQEFFESLPKLINLTHIHFHGAVLNNTRILQIGKIPRLSSLVLQDCAIIESDPEPLNINSLRLEWILRPPPSLQQLATQIGQMPLLFHPSQIRTLGILLSGACLPQPSAPATFYGHSVQLLSLRLLRCMSTVWPLPANISFPS